jgi:C4-dicarboxylate-specific signal transduction histidine kinase
MDLPGHSIRAAKPRFPQPGEQRFLCHAEEAAAGYYPALKVAMPDLCDRVEVRLRDSGMGVPKDLHDRIFDPLFTTKAAGKRMGLGLTI